MKNISGGYISIKWNESVKFFESFQDSIGIDIDNKVSELSLQLLFNANSTILSNQPNIISYMPDIIKLSKIESYLFFENGEINENIRQFLYNNNVIFSYDKKNLSNSKNLAYKKVHENVIIVLKRNKIKYIVVNNIFEFSFDNVEDFNVDFSLKTEIIKLYFRLYTYNQDSKVEIIKLIKDLNNIISYGEGVLTLGVINFFKQESEYLKEDLEILNA